MQICFVFFLHRNSIDKTENQPIAQGNKSDYLKNKKDNAEARKAKRRFEACKKEIASFEEMLENLEIEISENQTDHLKLTELFDKKDAAELKLLSLYEEMENFEKIFSE